MSNLQRDSAVDPGLVIEAAGRALRAIPPLWPLASSVAVNPYLGQSEQDLATTTARLSRVAGVRTTMPRSHYRARVAKGLIGLQDLRAAAARTGGAIDLGVVQAALSQDRPAPKALPNIADLVAEFTGLDWPGLIAERFGAFAAGYLDEGQALWASPRGRGAYEAWRAVATHDLTPEIAGLAGFARHVADAPESAAAAIARAVDHLGLPAQALDTYFHQALMSLGGFGQYARYRLWQAELAGKEDTTLLDFLAIRLVWDEALFLHHGARIADAWAEVKARHAAPITASLDDQIDAVLQDAAERAAQRALASRLAQTSTAAVAKRPVAQIAFCIDVRSEVFRRALESVHPDLQTLGFAGFFGLTARHQRFASDVAELRLPVLLNPGFNSKAGHEGDQARDLTARFMARAKRAWGRFKLAAVSSFAFVEATGPVYAAKLCADALGLIGNGTAQDPVPQFDPPLGVAQKIATAAAILNAMSLTQDFAPLVILAGHGANVVNNPHASGLHCGACGGYSGEVNARLLASLLNEAEVRTGLATQGLSIPDDTLFLAALHDTTTDHVTLFDGDVKLGSYMRDVEALKGWLAQAGRLARGERALRLPRATSGEALVARSSDWSQTRPEWALANCQAFIAAPRVRTRDKDLGGRAFLHDYVWRRDQGFGVLELIMTAPVVVASWISLQYYGSVVAPEAFGGGNKLLHNVTGGIGVVEGNGGLLRPGLPWQSVHDGEKPAHEPLRLSVCIEAPREAMTDVLRRHDGVRALFDNTWLHLFALDDQGRIAWRYVGDLQWAAVEGEEAVHLSAVA